MLLFKGYYMEFDEPASTKGKTFWRETERNRGRVREANLPTRVANHRVARNLHNVLPCLLSKSSRLP